MDKFSESAAILIKSIQYKNDPPKYVDYIRNNREYFPRVTDEDLVKILETYAFKESSVPKTHKDAQRED